MIGFVIVRRRWTSSEKVMVEPAPETAEAAEGLVLSVVDSVPSLVEDGLEEAGEERAALTKATTRPPRHALRVAPRYSVRSCCLTEVGEAVVCGPGRAVVVVRRLMEEAGAQRVPEAQTKGAGVVRWEAAEVLTAR